MERPQIITISGKPGSGKSSTADKVAELPGYTRYSSGDIVRGLIRRRGITLAEFNRLAAEDNSLDDEIDAELRKLRSERDLVVDSRLGFYWIPESFKVYLDLSTDVATARIFKDTVSNAARSGEASASIAEVTMQVEKRLASEQRRFQSRYGVNPFSNEHFDLVIDTSRHSPQTVALTVFDNYKKWLKSETWKRVESGVPLGYSLKNNF